jgi:hypothetical protein
MWGLPGGMLLWLLSWSTVDFDSMNLPQTGADFNVACK